MAAQPTFNWNGLGTQEGDRVYFSSFQFCQTKYQVGDHVYLLPEDEGAPLYIAKILKAFEDTTAEEGERLCIEVRQAAVAAGQSSCGCSIDYMEAQLLKVVGKVLPVTAAYWLDWALLAVVLTAVPPWGLSTCSYMRCVWQSTRITGRMLPGAFHQHSCDTYMLQSDNLDNATAKPWGHAELTPLFCAASLHTTPPFCTGSMV